MNTEPSYHPDADALSFNVKTLGLRWAEGGTERQRDAAWILAQHCWWADAKALAVKYGFETVHTHGRSGGWLTPYPGINPADASTDPDGFAEDLARIRCFGEALGELFNQVPEYFQSALNEALAHDEAVLARKAEAEARARREAEGLAKLTELAHAVRNCDTTSATIKKLANDALALFA